MILHKFSNLALKLCGKLSVLHKSYNFEGASLISGILTHAGGLMM